MNQLFTIMERFAPEAIEIMEVRYQVLRQILHNAPVGRRQIARNTGCSERLVRTEVDTLRERGAIATTPAGLYLTACGQDLLNEIDEVIPYLFKINTLADRLKERFDLKEVIIVPGDSYGDALAKKDLGRAAARFLLNALYPGCVVAVTGGTTLAEMADAIKGRNVPDVMVVPARGGLGEKMEQQASTIAARIAQAIGAQYRLLHIPDSLEQSTAEALKRDNHIREVVNLIKSSNLLIHGIGPAIEMANRRGLTAEQIQILNEGQAVGEALRYYFDNLGNIVYETPGIGLEGDDIASIDTVVAVAGGSNKAMAIESVLRNRRRDVLITDEGAAKKIICGKDDHKCR
ncbi:MAG TPA: transcriptional regulator [Syntrophomonas sp.]|jgi:central glycolytic genes regulator|nr:transcriptional regulator [Syntrophomonas sp.]